jgi:hypothetical protein
MTAGQMRSCEHATGGRCRCRCRGALHGVARADHPAELPDDDPHQPDGRQLELAFEGWA